MQDFRVLVFGALVLAPPEMWFMEWDESSEGFGGAYTIGWRL